MQCFLINNCNSIMFHVFKVRNMVFSDAPSFVSMPLSCFPLLIYMTVISFLSTNFYVGRDIDK